MASVKALDGAFRYEQIHIRHTTATFVLVCVFTQHDRTGGQLSFKADFVMSFEKSPMAVPVTFFYCFIPYEDPGDV